MIILGVIVWVLIWGFATLYVNEIKGYKGGFWLGFFLGFIGLIIVACKPNNLQTSSYSTNSYNTSLFADESKQRQNQQILSKGGWQCKKCGRVNPEYTSTCACGLTKQENKDYLSEREKEEAKLKKRETELQNVQKLKGYKDLLDAGAISQEEFDAKKKELLDVKM